jgi:hypothetical protein
MPSISQKVRFLHSVHFSFCSPHLSLPLHTEKINKEGRKGAIIFIDELDAIGTKRYGGEQSGDREVQRTMLELLNQLDGFSSNEKIKVIAATNRPDSLDPALLRSGNIEIVYFALASLTLLYFSLLVFFAQAV